MARVATSVCVATSGMSCGTCSNIRDGVWHVWRHQVWCMALVATSVCHTVCVATSGMSCGTCSDIRYGTCGGQVCHVASGMPCSVRYAM